MSHKPVLSIYPTLLDSFHWVKKMNYREDKVQELLDKINRIKPSEFPEAALKGIQFEDCVNKLLNGETLQELDDDYVTKNFSFNKQLVNKVAAKLKNAKKQQEYIQANVPTPIGLVKVYGFIDYTYDDFFIDLKTGSKYEIGKFKDNSQHKCYPFLAKLLGRKQSGLKYYVTDFRNTFLEQYTLTPEMEDEFVSDIVTFNYWLEENRNLITDTKIWGL